MANIKVVVSHQIYDGVDIIFRTPCDCSEISGITVHFVQPDNSKSSKEFILKDAHNRDIGDLTNLFASGVLIKVLLDVTNGYAYIQNADTNSYLENKMTTSHESLERQISDVQTSLGTSIDQTKSDLQKSISQNASTAQKNLDNAVSSLDSSISKATSELQKELDDSTTSLGRQISESEQSVRGDILSADDIVNLYVWRKYTEQPRIERTEVVNLLVSEKYQISTTNDWETVQYSNSITLNEDGTISLNNPSSIKVESQESADTLIGKYITVLGSGKYYFIPSTAVMEYSQTNNSGYTNYYRYHASVAEFLTARGTFMRFVASKLSNAYPSNGEHTDSNWYKYHKQLGE